VPGAIDRSNAKNSTPQGVITAAIAAIRASNPFPPLPVQFKGDRIGLQLNFAYNMPKQ